MKHMERIGTVKASSIKTRDYLMVRIINGATKANVAKDRRKEKNRRECRDWKYR